MIAVRKFNLIIKRLIDFFGSLIGLIILLPFLVFISIIVKSTSKGSIFFKQERLGRDGKIFKIIKFRTMVVGAEKMGDGLCVNNEDDIRITKIGRILRATSLDELPQLWNVIVGDMSLVGPRPPVTYHPYNGYDGYPVWAKLRFKMRPGITGLSQIIVRNAVSWEKRILIDVKYITNFNMLLDFKILFMTVQKVYYRESIYADKKAVDINR